MTERFEEAELAAAERLDGEITELLAGRPAARTEPAALWLAASLRSTPPLSLRRRVAGIVRETRGGWHQWAVRLAAAALGLTFVLHGASNQVLSEWVAAQLGEPHSWHAYLEGGWALIAAGIAVGAGALRRRWLPVSVGAGVPLGVLFGLHGVPELGVFALGAALHLTEGLLAVVLLVTWWLSSRYSPRGRPEGRA